MDFLDRIREKPREVKDRYAILAALIVAGIIGSIWVFSLPARLSSLTTDAVQDDGPSGLSEFLDTVETQVSNVVESVSEQDVGEAPSFTETLDTQEATPTKATENDERTMATSTKVTTEAKSTSTPKTTTTESSSASPGSVILIGTTTGALGD